MSSIGRRVASSTVLGSPRTGPRRYELNRELEFGRPVQLGATPIRGEPSTRLEGLSRQKTEPEGEKSGFRT